MHVLHKEVLLGLFHSEWGPLSHLKFIHNKEMQARYIVFYCFLFQLSQMELAILFVFVIFSRTVCIMLNNSNIIPEPSVVIIVFV